MGTFKFEEYRQPWETGPHWELKKEFMERYQNDFPEDRLLCLAQAYSNIELMSCSYPDPVMLQIHELSKSLHGCKRFREGNNSFGKSEGKRSLPDDDSTKSFKFIKFCSAGNQISKTTPIDSASSGVKIPSDAFVESVIPSNDFSSVKISSDAVSSGLKISLDKSASVDTNNESVLNKISSSHDSICSLLSSINQSPHLKLIIQFAEEIKKRGQKNSQSLKALEATAQLLNALSLVSYKFLNSPVENKPVCICEFYIGSVLISTGRDNNERNARVKAAEYAVEILSNLSNLPTKTLNDFKNNEKLHTNDISVNVVEKKNMMLNTCDLQETKGIIFDNSDLCFLKKIAEEVKKCAEFVVSSLQVIQQAVEYLKCYSDVFYFNVTEEPDSPLHCRIFCCDLTIRRTFICRGKGYSKKKAKLNAAECGVLALINFINSLNGIQEDVKVNLTHKCSQSNPAGSVSAEKDNKVLYNVDASNVSKNSEKHQTNSVTGILSDDKKAETGRTSKSQLVRENIINKFKHSSEEVPGSFMEHGECVIDNSVTESNSFIAINQRLLHNSFDKRLVIFDTSDVKSVFQQTPGAILNYSAQFCQKSVSCEIDESGITLGQPLVRCDVFLDGEFVATGAGNTKMEAKTLATYCAIESLQKQVYTIKVKNELDEGFVINRNQIINANVNANALSDSNIGCKMLKMMGWSGGSIGKAGGITEPIMASEHRYNQGLGFSNSRGEIQKFTQKIEALIRDFSQTDTTSDLIFATDFTKEERKQIHKIATKYNLNSNSRGKDQQRQLFIRRKYTIVELLNNLVKNGGCTPKFKLVDMSSQ